MDQDALIACADLVGRTGARQFEIGYLHDDVPSEEAAWYCSATLKGAKIIEENHRDPIAAAEALARRILTGAKCRCGKLVALSDSGAVAYENVTMADGTKWSTKQARKAGQCRWRRVGDRWKRGCE